MGVIAGNLGSKLYEFLADIPWPSWSDTWPFIVLSLYIVIATIVATLAPGTSKLPTWAVYFFVFFGVYIFTVLARYLGLVQPLS